MDGSPRQTCSQPSIVNAGGGATIYQGIKARRTWLINHSLYIIMKKSLISLSLALSISAFIIVAYAPVAVQAQTAVVCPSGSTCMPINPTQPVNCPAGYVCTPISTASSGTQIVASLDPSSPTSSTIQISPMSTGKRGCKDSECGLLHF